MLLIVAAWIFIQTPFGQNWIVGKVTQRLSRDLNTKINIKNVDFSLFNKMHLEGVMVEDQFKDTLLYAGEVQLRITDWFFFKDNIVLKYVGLKNAVVKMQRKDSVWNHQFIIDYFSSPSGGNSKSGQTAFDLKQVDLQNVVFIQKDAWLGQDMTIALKGFTLDAQVVNFSKNTIHLGTLNLDGPYFSLYNYPKLKPASPSELPAALNPILDSSLKWNKAGWIVEVDKLNIINGTFKTDRKTDRAPYPYFDGQHVEFGQINSSFTNLRWEKDTITANLDLKTKERSGFEVKQMVAQLKMTPQEMAFDKLDIKSNNSHISNYFRMSYEDFSSMNDFIHQVKMLGIFDGSDIDSDDIAFFAPTMKTWKKQITLSGTIRGTVDDLVGKNLEIQAGKNTLLSGDLSMTGLPDIQQTFIDFKANDFRTTYEDAVAFVPDIRKVTQPNLRQLRYLRFNGSFTGFIRDFVTFGTLQTNLGTITSDLNMKLPDKGQPVYSGTISTDFFRIGDLIGDPKLGVIALNGSLKGRGIDEKNRQADIDGKVKFVDYNGYRFNNIELNGRIDKKRFDGMLAVDDPELKFVLNGVIDFNNKTPSFNFLADAQKTNLKKLNLTRDSLSFSGKINLNFTGDNIDNFLGYAQITEASLTKDGNLLPFDSLVVSSAYINDIKTLTAKSNEFEAKVSGNFNIRDLPDAFKLFLNKYYPAYIKPPNHIPENQSLAFDITTFYVEDFTRMLDSSFSGFNNSHITGNLNTGNNELNLLVDVPQFKYKQYNFDDVKLKAVGSRDSLALNGSAANVNISDSLNIPFTEFRINAHNDSSQIAILTGANQAINRANLNATLLTYYNGVKIEFDTSSFVVNDKTWTIEDKGELEFRRNIPASGQLVLHEQDQLVKVKTQPSETGDWNDLVVELSKINLGDFSPFFMPRNQLEGLVTGKIIVEDPTNNLYVSTENLMAESVWLDKDSLGNIRADLVYDSKTKKLTTKGTTLGDSSNLAFDVNLFLGDKEQQKNNLIAVTTKSFQLSILQRFLGNLFTDIQGYVTGNFQLQGELEKLNITGKGRLVNAGLKVNFTQCFYEIEDTELELKSNAIDLNGFVLRDPVSRNPVYLTGEIQHTGFKDMFFDLTVSTRRPGTSGSTDNRPILLLNTTFNDNQQFYGRVKGTGSFSLSGPQSNMFMKVDAIASTTDSSTVTLPSSKSRESGIADFLVERKYGTEMSDSSLSEGSNITYDVDVTANPMVLVKVILDDLTGDKIEGRGTGTLNIHSGTSEKMSMIGKFDIRQGNYLFTFQSIFKKPFVIVEGADNSIVWTGDPYAAKIKFEAKYIAEKVSYAPLVNVLNFDPSYNRIREDVYVVVNLTGDLFKPEFKFHLEFPPNSSVKNDFYVASQIQQMEKNENEITRQVTYLIVFNSYAPPETSGAGNFGNTINETLYSTISSISGMFFNEINKKLNSELAKILKTDNISINFSGSVYNRNLLDQQGSNGFNINQSNFNVNVPISLFKDRFIVTLGSTFDVPLQATIQQNVQFLPDVTAEWLINQSGTIRASFFYRENLDYLTTNNSSAARTKRSGASIAYRKEFDSLGEFFNGKKRKKQQQQQQPPPPVEEKKAGSN